MKRHSIRWIFSFFLLFLTGTILAQTPTDPIASDYDEEALRRRRNKDKIYYEDGVIYENTQDKGSSICAYQSVKVYKKPGRDQQQVTEAFFTEELQHLGKEGYVKQESSNYLYVRTASGRKGWVQANYVVRDGGVVVITNDAPIYENPNARSSITQQSYYAGEIVILDDFKDGWVHLTNQRKTKSGWVQGYEKLSLESADIEAAALYAEALKINDLQSRRIALLTIAQGRGQISPEMDLVIQDAVRKTDPNYRPPTTAQPTQPNNPSYPYYPNGEDGLAQPGSVGDLSDAPYTMPPNATVPLSPEQKYNYYVEKVVDRQTGQYYNRVVETGGIQAVKAKNPKDIYYAYHKTLPIGSMILLEVPGTGSYIQLEIVARLRADNPNVVGLGAEVIKKVYGEVSAREVYGATIIYPQG